jgi:hypothetical protein
MAAAAILEINEMLSIGLLTHDFDEIWYTDYKKHAEIKKRKSKSLLAFSNTAAAAISNYKKILSFG